MAIAKRIKKENEPNEITADDLRKYEGLENLTDGEADNIATSLKLFSLITYQLFDTTNNPPDG